MGNRNAAEVLSMGSDKDRLHILFGGTTIIQSTAALAEHGSTGGKGSAAVSPDGGCIALVLRTGFYTSQGKLMRTILFASERVTAGSKESLLFILCLLCAAITASVYVLINGNIKKKMCHAV